MNKRQILQLLTDYCRTMLYGGKTLLEVESFLHVLRNYLQHGEFMRILRNLKQLEVSLAYTPTQTSPRPLAKAPDRFIFRNCLLPVGLGMYFLVQVLNVIPIYWGMFVGVGVVAVMFVLMFGGTACIIYATQRYTVAAMNKIWQTLEWLSLLMSVWLVLNVWNPVFLDILGYVNYYFILSCLSMTHTPIWINWFWRGAAPQATNFISTRRLQQTSRLNNQQNIPDPEKVVIEFIEFFEEEARRRRENSLADA